MTGLFVLKVCYFFFYKIVCFIPSGTEEVKKGEDTAVIKTEGKAPEFVLKIQTETVSCYILTICVNLW